MRTMFSRFVFMLTSLMLTSFDLSDVKRADPIPVSDLFCKKCFPCKNQISQNCSQVNCKNLNSIFQKVVFDLPNRTRGELDPKVENLISSISCCTEEIFMKKENLEICEATCSKEHQLSNCNFDNQYCYQSCTDCKGELNRNGT